MRGSRFGVQQHRASSVAAVGGDETVGQPLPTTATDAATVQEAVDSLLLAHPVQFVDGLSRDATSTTTMATSTYAWVTGNQAGSGSVWGINGTTPRTGYRNTAVAYPAWAEVEWGLNDVDLQFVLQALTGATDSWAGIFARKGAEPNTYYALEAASNGAVRLVAYVAGVVTVLATTTGFVAGERLRLRVAGSSVRAWSKGVLFADLTDALIATGTRIGLTNEDANASGARYRDFYAQAVA